MISNLLFRLARRCGEIIGEFDEYDLYKMVAANKGKERPLFDLLCKSGPKNYKLNTCGNGFDQMLDPKSWQKKKGDSYTKTPVRRNSDGTYSDYHHDDEDYDEEDYYSDYDDHQEL